MPSLDLLSPTIWYFLIFIIGFAFLPFTVLIFKSFFDKGYIFSKILGILVFSYLIFSLSTIKILSLTQENLLIALSLTSVIFFIIPLYLNKNLKSIIKENTKKFFFLEILFLVMFITWAFLRSHNPSIYGIEKYMDFGFVNSVIRSDYLPAKDMWFAQHSINYYYFGHFITAILTKISGIPPQIAFNLMLATIFSFILTLAFSLGLNLIYFSKEKISATKIVAGGFLSAFLITLSGNMHTVYAFFGKYQNGSPPFWELNLSINTFPNSYWYPQATRFIENTIHEFPSYALVLSDLHAHLLGTPIALLAIALLVSFFVNRKRILGNIKPTIGYLILFSLVLSLMYMTNSFDLAIYLFLGFFIIVYSSMLSEKPLEKKLFIKPALFFMSILFLVFLFSLPFSLFFKPFVSGIGFLCPPDFLSEIGKIGLFIFEADFCQKTPPWQFFILYGFFVFWVFSFLIFKKRGLSSIDKFLLLITSVCLFLVIIPEFFYLKDIYPTHYRANTMFKISYQVFVLMSLATSYFILRIFFELRLKDYKNIDKLIVSFWSIFAFLLIFLVSLYPFFAITSSYNLSSKPRTLDGLYYLKNKYPDDYSAINWLNENIKTQVVILEAQGDPYTDYGRISSNTGLPTVLQWPAHQWLWRGSYDILAPRIEEVRELYEGDNLEKTLQLIKKYNIRLIFLGRLENEKYRVNNKKIEMLGDIIFSSGDTKIYEISETIHSSWVK